MPVYKNLIQTYRLKVHMLKLSFTPLLRNATISPVASKSESNRALVIRHLSKPAVVLHNLSDARDTQTMVRLLAGTNKVWDVGDAGTAMRFLTALSAVTHKKLCLTGTARMQERPLGILVEALRQLGTKINYLKKTGYPPINTAGFAQKTAEISIRSDVSSQYISALLLVAPVLPQGLSLTLEGKASSMPYIEMTLSLMQHFGIKYAYEGNKIVVLPQAYRGGCYSIEADWSAASYWYACVAIAKNASLRLKGFRKKSFQGDAIIAEIMDSLGVSTEFEAKDDIILRKKPHKPYFSFDFTACPDLAQTVAVVCAAKGIEAKLSGLKSLRIKETDRIEALKTELLRLNVPLEVTCDDALWIKKTVLKLPSDKHSVATYNDHRMAMAFAPLAMRGNLSIENPEVVRKSYPRFWADLAEVGVTFEHIFTQK